MHPLQYYGPNYLSVISTTSAFHITDRQPPMTATSNERIVYPYPHRVIGSLNASSRVLASVDDVKMLQSYEMALHTAFSCSVCILYKIKEF